MGNYWRYSRSTYYSVVMALPLLLTYEILIILTHSNYWVIRNAADVWIRTFLMAFDLKAQHITFVMIGVLFVLIPITKIRCSGITIKIKYIFIMLVESLAYSIILGVILQLILKSGGLSAGGLGNNVLQNIALSLGAGFFEEIIFRVFLLSLLFLMFKLLTNRIVLAGVFSILISSLLFSISHYVGSMADSWELYSFMFRWIAGMLFTILYFLRGFAITAYTHALYDIWVLV